MIRSFDNQDARALHQIWQAHHAALGQSPHVTVDHLERAIMGRSWFDPEHLLVVEGDSGTPIAWCQVVRSHPENESPTENEIGQGSRILSVMTNQPGLDEATLAALADEVTRRMGPLVAWGNAVDSQFGYAGIDPLGWGVGIEEEQAGFHEFLRGSGFRIESRYERLILPLRTFRMPVNRQFLMWRRSAAVESSWTLPTDLGVAKAMSHLDREQLSITTRDGPLAQLVVWTTDREAAVMPPTHALLDLHAISAASDEAFQFGVGCAAGELAGHGVERLEAVVAGDQEGWRESLVAMGFQPAGRGATYFR